MKLIDWINKLLRETAQEELEERVEQEAEDELQKMHLLGDPRFYGPDY